MRAAVAHIGTIFSKIVRIFGPESGRCLGIFTYQTTRITVARITVTVHGIGRSETSRQVSLVHCLRNSERTVTPESLSGWTAPIALRTPEQISAPTLAVDTSRREPANDGWAQRISNRNLAGHSRYSSFRSNTGSDVKVREIGFRGLFGHANAEPGVFRKTGISKDVLFLAFASCLPYPLN